VDTESELMSCHGTHFISGIFPELLHPTSRQSTDSRNRNFSGIRSLFPGKAVLEKAGVSEKDGCSRKRDSFGKKQPFQEKAPEFRKNVEF
jgi:hypothetical protein